MTTDTSRNSMLNYKQVADRLGVPLGTVYAWVHEKKIPHVRLGARLVRFERDAIDKFIEMRRKAYEQAS